MATAGKISPTTNASFRRRKRRASRIGNSGEITDNLAKGLLGRGIRRGDRVGVWSINRWEWIAVANRDGQKIGAALVNVNPAYRTHELQYVLSQSGAATIVLMDSFKSSTYKKNAAGKSARRSRARSPAGCARESCPTCATSS